MGFFQQEYWSGLPFPFLGDCLHPGIKPVSLVFPALQINSLMLKHMGEAQAIVHEGHQRVGHDLVTKQQQYSVRP